MNSYNYTTKKVKAKRRRYAPRPSYTSQDTGWSNLVVSIEDNDKIREIIDGTTKLDFIKKEITPSIIDGFWTIGEKPTYVKARADVLKLEYIVIDGSENFRNGEGSVTYQSRISYNGKDITDGAMAYGVKLQWFVENQSGKNRHGVPDSEFMKNHNPDTTNTNEMTYTHDDFQSDCKVRTGCYVVNEELLNQYINELSKSKKL